jgi:hypothetical protein
MQRGNPMVNMLTTMTADGFENTGFAPTADATEGVKSTAISVQPEPLRNNALDPSWIEDFAAHANAF